MFLLKYQFTLHQPFQKIKLLQQFDPKVISNKQDKVIPVFQNLVFQLNILNSFCINLEITYSEY